MVLGPIVRSRPAGGGHTTFLEHGDTPSSYTGEGGKGVRVNVGESALEFYTLLATFLGLTDTPASYSGQAGKGTRVNAGENALEFFTLPTTFLGLTDTPANYTGQGLKELRVNAGENAVEFTDQYAAAHTWAALQTFSAGLKLAAAQQIHDSGGTGRILLATASPNITLTGATRINDNAAIACAPFVPPAQDLKLNLSPVATDVTNWLAIRIAPSLTLSGSNRYAAGIFGSANLTIPAATSGHNAYGLQFAAYAIPAGAAAAAYGLTACIASPGVIAVGAGKSLTVTNYKGLETAPAQNLTVIFATATLTNAYGLHIKGGSFASVTCPNFYGIRLEDFTGVSGNNYLMEIGPATPYLRLLGGAAPGPNLTNLYLNENGNLRRVQWKDGAAIGAGDKVLVLV